MKLNLTAISNRAGFPAQYLKNKILIVDDEELLSFAIANYLKRHGFEVDSASEREEAESLLAYHKYDLVILDVRLGGLNEVEGIHILEYIRERCPETQVMIMTAYGSVAVKERAYSLQVNEFLHKPLPLSELERKVRSLLGNTICEEGTAISLPGTSS